MYVTNHKATMALDGKKTGRQIWKSGVEYPAETPRVASCGINRGAAMLDGKLFRTTLDAHVIALDMATGAELYATIDSADGYFTVALFVANGVVIVGISGGEGERGYIEGYDANSGERLWEEPTVPAWRNGL